MALEVDIRKKLGKFYLDVEIGSESRRIGILGASGCGKSMTLKCIAGIETPDEGRIAVGGRTLFDTERRCNLKPQKRNVGYLFQNYALFPAMSVRKNIAAGLNGSKAEKEQRVQEMIRKFRLEGLEEQLPGELSGGQQQRVALARIMAYEPDVILLDEPYAALDSFLKERLQQEMQELLAEYPGTVILVSHSRDEIYRFSEEVLIMDAGRILCGGKTKEVFERPGYAQAARLTGCRNIAAIQRKNGPVLEVPGWNLQMELSKEIPAEVRYVGIRAHDFVPVWGEQEPNCIPAGEARMAELPFERNYFLRSTDEEQEGICWAVQRHLWQELDEKGMPDYLRIPEEKVLLLR